MYYRLREREQTPGRVSLSVGLGTLIGCLPLYGLHLALCFGLAKLFRLSGPIAYLAAHVNNPWSAPVLLYLETTVGHRLMRGSWLSLDPRALRAAGGLELGRDLLVGSAAVGVVLAGAFALVSYAISSRRQRSPTRLELVNRAARRYQELGLGTWEGARAKLRYDPVYLGILSSIALPPTARIVDLGCGRGIFLAAIGAARELAGEGFWPAGWPEPPSDPELIGIEVDPEAAGKAVQALDEQATIQIADLRSAALPTCDVAVLLDVLHYLDGAEQDDLIARLARSLRPGGLILLREADAGGGLRFLLTRAQERLSSWARLEATRRFCYRSADEWAALLGQYGLTAQSRPMAAGTPFANFLLEARRPVDQA